MILKIWIFSLFVKLILSYFLPLSPDEAYYWVWSHNLQLSYFDHPAVVSWLFYLGQPFENLGSMVRWPAVFLIHGTFWVWIKILKPYLNDSQLIIWTILWLLNPLTGPGSIVLTPDLPLMIFWPLATYSYIKTLEKLEINWAILLGISLGLGFCSKYHMALFGILALTHFIYSKSFSKKHLKCLMVTLFVFTITSSPVWFWNLKNDFISLKFQLNHGLGQSKWNYQWTLTYVLGQLLLLLPPIAFYYAKSLKKYFSKNVLFVLLSLGPILFFLLTSFKGKVEANWPIVGYPLFLALAAVTIPKKWYRFTLTFWVLLLTITTVALLGPSQIAESINFSKINEIHKINTLALKTKQYEPLYATTYQVASKISFEQKRKVLKLKGSNRVDFYDFLPESNPNFAVFYLLLKNGDIIPEEIHSKYNYNLVEEIMNDFYIWKFSAK